MKAFADGALPVLIGAALEVSDPTGSTLSLLAWVAVGLLAVFLVSHRIRHRHGKAKASHWHRLGGELLAFVRGRRGDAPPATRQRWGMGRRSDADAEQRQFHDADTMQIYLERFAEQVSRALRQLREAGLVGEIEAETLASPASPEAIEVLGQRLMDLSYQSPLGN